jgi:hypothetical protein
MLIIGIALVSGVLISNSLGKETDHYKIGSGDSDWWNAYPSQSTTNAGLEVHHPQWVLEALKNKPVLIYVHKGCSYCKPQTEAVANISKEYSGDIEVFDFPVDEGDKRAEEALQAYDPNGGVTYVPMTIIVTLAPDSAGKVQPVWHSTEEVTGDAWIKSYIDDAMSYHGQNSISWKQ